MEVYMVNIIQCWLQLQEISNTLVCSKICCEYKISIRYEWQHLSVTQACSKNIYDKCKTYVML